MSLIGSECVYRGKGMLDAESMKLNHQSYEIESFIIQESAGATYGLSWGEMGTACVHVKNEKAKEAKKLIAEIYDSDSDVDEESDPDIESED